MEAEYRLTLFIGLVLRHGRLNTGFKNTISAFSASTNKMRVKEFLKKDITHEAKDSGERTRDSRCYQNIGSWKVQWLVVGI